MLPSRFPVIVAGVALAGLLAYVIVVLAPQAVYRKDFGFELRMIDGRPTVSEVRGGPAVSGLQRGDVVVSWNGDDQIQRGDLASYQYRQPAAPYTLVVERMGRRGALTLVPALVSNPVEPARTISLATVATAWAAIGVIVIAMRPADRASRYCAAFMILAAASQFGISLANIDHPPGRYTRRSGLRALRRIRGTSRSAS